MIEVFSETVVLTNAQIKALPTTPIRITGSFGDGVLIVPTHALLEMHAVTPYGNFDLGYTAGLQYESPSNSELLIAGLDVFLGLGADASMQAVLSAPSFPSFTDSNADNKPLELFIANGGAGNLSGGNAANTLTVTVFYSKVTL